VRLSKQYGFCAVATRGKFQLIEVTIPRGVLSDTLARFVAGVKRLNAPR